MNNNRKNIITKLNFGFEKFLYRRLILLFCTMSFLCIPKQTYASEENSIDNAKKGIVEIQSGINDTEGIFRQMQFGSGFLISNDEQGIYVVTALEIIENSTEERKKYCELHSILTEGNIPENVIRVIVTGDVTVEASVLTKSVEQGFCILSIDNVVNEKQVLRLGDSSLLQKENNVYSLGFPDNIDGLEFMPDEVEIQQGQMQESVIESVYLQHSAAVSTGNFGGPLLDEKGYVIGVNCCSKKSGNVQSLAINEIKDVLNNFSIYYESVEEDDLREKIDTLYAECKFLSEDGRYKKDSLIKLQEAVALVEQVYQQEHPTIENLEHTYMNLASAKVTLVPKMKKTLVAIYVLLGIILLLAVRIVQLWILNVRNKRAIVENTMRQSAPVRQQSEELLSEGNQNLVQNFYVGNLHGNEQAVQQQVIIEQTMETLSMKKPAWQQHITIMEHPVEGLQQPTIQLLREKNGDVIKINKQEFLIGKLATSDYCIVENNAVSRKHAQILQRQGMYYIEDLNSANGTFVNGRKVGAGKVVELRAGDTLVLANEKFKVN